MTSDYAVLTKKDGVNSFLQYFGREKDAETAYYELCKYWTGVCDRNSVDAGLPVIDVKLFDLTSARGSIAAAKRIYPRKESRGHSCV